MCPLNIIRVVHVPNAGIAEQLLFHILAAQRVDSKREVFDMTGCQQLLDEAFNQLEQIFALLNESVTEYSLENFRTFYAHTHPANRNVLAPAIDLRIAEANYRTAEAAVRQKEIELEMLKIASLSVNPAENISSIISGYKCKRCGWRTESLSKFRNHCNRKIRCLPISQDLPIDFEAWLLEARMAKIHTCPTCKWGCETLKQLETHQRQCHHLARPSSPPSQMAVK